MSPQAKRGTQRESLPLVRVSVHAPGGAHFEGQAVVTLRKAGAAVASLEREGGSLLYAARVTPGRYELTAEAADLRSPPRLVDVPDQGKTASVYLGQPEWPFYRMGENTVPFDPREDILAVAFDTRVPSLAVARRTVEQLAAELPVEPFPHGERREDAFITAGGAIWLLRLREAAARERVTSRVRDLAGPHARVGLAVDLIPGQVKVLDNRFVVRFRADVAANSIPTLIAEAGSRLLRGFAHAPGAHLIEFSSGTFRDHLARIEAWYERGLLAYGEPDLLAEIKDDVFPVDPPDDPTFPNQANLTLQNVDDAWVVLQGQGANLAVGSPSVYVATVDRGVDTDHPDIGGNLTDGTAQLAQCYDFSGLRPCTVPGYAPDSDHGMGVYGIIAALTNNATAIAGVAPNTHQIGIERPDLTSANYSDMLLWAGGFMTGNVAAGWPAEPIAPAADIISCSHGADGLALSGIMDDTFQTLARDGRGGRGTIVIYSAGNGAALITGFRTWAAHPDTIAVSNSRQPDATGVERLDPTSNFGPEIDLCAQGAGAPSLDAAGGEQIFGGTSAAAPTVAAATGLILSVRPQLCLPDVRRVLRDTAVTIDAANANPVGQWVDTDGDGAVDFSQWYGRGRLDVERAVRAAVDDEPCYAPTFRAQGCMACFLQLIALAPVIAILLILSLFVPSLRCELNRLRFRIQRCSRGNSDPCVRL